MATGTGPVMGPIWFANIAINGTDLPANVVQDDLAPVTGFVHEMVAVVQTNVTTGGTITATDATTGVTLGSVTIPNGATKGQVFLGTVTPGTTETGAKQWPAITKNDDIKLTPAGFASAGAVRVQLRGYSGE